ncbi:hypothetical protein C8Q80DRAFT_1122971 [Daedaleopsis nitida]|nr:hypothetical protein C8Q80DRAFT_1122971 [Daedaleopsis nitida]
MRHNADRLSDPGVFGDAALDGNEDCVMASVRMLQQHLHTPRRHDVCRSLTTTASGTGMHWRAVGDGDIIHVRGYPLVVFFPCVLLHARVSLIPIPHTAVRVVCYWEVDVNGLRDLAGIYGISIECNFKYDLYSVVAYCKLRPSGYFGRAWNIQGRRIPFGEVHEGDNLLLECNIVCGTGPAMERTPRLHLRGITVIRCEHNVMSA